MATFALDRLWEVLQRIDADMGNATWSDTAEAAYHAWAIVDAAHRFHTLLTGLPGLSQKGWVKNASKWLSQAEDYRHGWQHQRNEAPKIVERRSQAFGTIGWVQQRDDGSTGQWFFATAGHDFVGAQWIAGPHRVIRGVGKRRIRLIYGKEEPLYLSRLVRVIREAIGRLCVEIRSGRLRLVGEASVSPPSPDRIMSSGVMVIYKEDDPSA